MSLKTAPIVRLALLILFSAGFTAVAQLKADFTIDKPGGCSPLSVSFTNATTGASANATYKWDLGNGNTSALVNAGATYTTEKTYTITLTVSDGTKTAIQTKQVTVYKTPLADFSASPATGCLPLPVNLVSSSTPGDGAITNYFWDFGDGNTQQGSGLQQVLHTYNFIQHATVSLTVTNNYGCYTTTRKSAANVLQAIQASFTADKTVLCAVTDAVNFSNSSTGPGTLSYVWDFGDGTTSTTVNPSHTYAKKGLYTVKLTVSNTDGCSNTEVLTNYINVSNFIIDFDVPAVLCRGAAISFADKSTAGGTNEILQIDGVSYAYYPGFSYSFPTAGNHTVQLTATYGVCTLSSDLKTINVKELPNPQPFIINIPVFCTTPVTVNFKDTTKEAVAWLWKFDVPYGNSSSNVRAPSFSYDPQGTYYISLAVTNAAGCSATETQSINIDNSDASAYLVSSQNLYGCGAITATFAAAPYDQITSYQWIFGDGATSTDPQPTHVFTEPGTYIIKLNYTMKGGCKASTDYSSITVYKKPVADFSSSGVNICGNTPVSFIDKSTGPVTSWNWDFGTANYTSNIGGTSIQNPLIQYTDSGTYTVQLIAYNGSCSDTMKKTGYIKALPSYPKISGAYNTCDGTRGLVKFTEASKYALSWKWDFGDGSTQSYTTRQDTIAHTYTKTGTYSVVLTTVNGQCTDTSNMTVYVLLKQNPLLTSSKSAICTNELMPVLVSNYDFNPNPNFIDVFDADYYIVTKWQYGDSSTYSGQLNRVDSMGFWTPWYSSLKGSLANLSPGENRIRLISTSMYFGCSDTSNFLSINIKGPVAGFEITTNNVCYKSPVILVDTSHSTGNSPLKTWTWNFGDGSSLSLPTGGTVSHNFLLPGYFYPSVTVTDQQGCSATSAYNSVLAQVNGPAAAFTYSPSFVSPNTTVSFFNNTNNSGVSNVQYQWTFGDGSSSTDPYPSHLYPVLGVDTVTLIATNPVTQCADTNVQVIHVKNINASFTYTTSYINNNSCPPFLVNFNSTSSNASRIAWDFGDGSGADNQITPSHTYNNAGVYIVTLYAYAPNGYVDSTQDSITVKGPYAILHADLLWGCLAQTITLSASVKNASSFTWDFADGTIKQTSDTFAVHAYLTPGFYEPSLILKDVGGCSSTSSLGDTIVIDTLNAQIKKSTGHVCDSAWVSFAPDVVSLAADKLHKPLSYKWDFGTGNPADTSNVSTPLFFFHRPGKYVIRLQVQSPYGCMKQATDTVEVIAVSKAGVTGPVETCPDILTSFHGTATRAGNNMMWAWSFTNGDGSDQQSAKEAFPDSGSYNIQLVLTNNGCMDTAYHLVIVHPKPMINLLPQNPAVCLGKFVQLHAGGGTRYTWTPAVGLDNDAIAAPTASPLKTTTYTVQVVNSFGCINSDSSTVIVAGPFVMQVPVDTFVCVGSSVTLYASGAHTYQWINFTDGLNNTQIPDPVASPRVPVVYTVVGYDAYGCFTDTANVPVRIEALPTVSAGPDVETLTGSAVPLFATGSSDVIAWNWLPPDYLSCTDCASPVSEPRNNINYIVTGTNKFGCAASDTMMIKLICAQDRVYIPDAFSPNNDGKNDVFFIKGKGIRTIKSFRIFSRWGEKVFEKSNINIDDRSAGWDGYYKGSPAPIGTYVYFAELLCDTGEVFPVKGSVIVIR